MPGSSYFQSSAAKQATLGAGDASKTIIAAPGAGKKLVVTKIIATVVTVAAQTVDIEDTSGTVEVLKLPASAAGQYRAEFGHGMELTTNEALIIKPAAAGPAIHVSAEAYVVG